MQYQQINGHVLAVEAEPDGLYFNITSPEGTGPRVALGRSDVERLRALVERRPEGRTILFADMEATPPRSLGVYKRQDGVVELLITVEQLDDPVQGQWKYVLASGHLPLLKQELAAADVSERPDVVQAEGTRVEHRLVPVRSRDGRVDLDLEEFRGGEFSHWQRHYVSDAMSPDRWAELADALTRQSQETLYGQSDGPEREELQFEGTWEGMPYGVVTAVVTPSESEAGAVGLYMASGSYVGEDDELTSQWKIALTMSSTDVEEFRMALQDAEVFDDLENDTSNTVELGPDFSPRDALLERSTVSSSFDRYGTMTIHLGTVNPDTESVEWTRLPTDSLSSVDLAILEAALRDPYGGQLRFRDFDGESDQDGLVLQIERPDTDQVAGAIASDVRLRLIEEYTPDGSSSETVFDGVVNADVAEELAADSGFAASIDDVGDTSQAFADATHQATERAHRMVSKPATVKARQPSINTSARQETTADPLRDAAMHQAGQAAGLAGPA